MYDNPGSYKKFLQLMKTTASQLQHNYLSDSTLKFQDEKKNVQKRKPMRKPNKGRLDISWAKQFS